jgi:hypothetical protein
MSETDVARVSLGLMRSFRAAFARTLYREEIVLAELLRRLAIGGAIVGLQFYCLWRVDRHFAQAEPPVTTAYVHDAAVFWLTFWPSALAVALAIFACRMLAAFQEVRKGAVGEEVLTWGERVTAELRRADVERDERRMLAAHKRAMFWQRVDLPAMLTIYPELKTAFDASTYRAGPYVSDWQLPAMWIPAMERDTGKLRDALEARRVAVRKARGALDSET